MIPVMLYDGDCGFCRWLIERWQHVTKKYIRYEPYQRIISDFPQLTEEQCRTAVQLILPDDSVFSGAHAMFKALALSGKAAYFLWAYDHIPFFGRISEMVYQYVA